MKVNAKRKNNGAFTLIETLIAIVVLSIVLLFLYFIFKTTLRNRSLTLKSGKPYIEANLIYAEFHKKIMEFNYLYPVLIGTYRKKNEKKLSSIYFSGLSKTPVPFSKAESKENMNYFYLKRQKRKKTYELIYEQSFYKNKKGYLKVTLNRVIIAKNLTFLNIRYYYGGLWLDKFDYIRYNSAPSSVKLKFGIFKNSAVKQFRFQFNMQALPQMQ